MDKKAILSGVIPRPPFILCRSEEVASMIMASLYKDYSRTPPVMVADEWGDDWEAGAVIVTPLDVIGSEPYQSFSIQGDIGDRERDVLDAYIRIKRMSGGDHVAYRDLTTALNMDRRVIQASLKKLEQAGIGYYRDKGGFTLDIGTWRVDQNKAKALGLEITTFD